MPDPSIVRVEIDGKIVMRLRRVHVLQDTAGGTVVCMRPTLWPGERLIERPGQIPMIVKDAPCTTAT